MVREYEFLADDIRFTFRGERHFTAARGSGGGADGSMSIATIYRSDGRIETISKCVTTVSRGDRLVLETAGGAGYGDAAGRAPEALATDVANRKVSAVAAHERYANAKGGTR